jgi:hypothetical protein
MDDFLLVNAGLNLQKFENNKHFSLEEHPEIMEALNVFPNGEICGIRLEAIEEVLNDTEVDNIRNELKAAPKHVEIRSARDFLKVIAYYIDIEEY